jgi:hypothetical protein
VIILAIDPGPVYSAWVRYEHGRNVEGAKSLNRDVRAKLVIHAPAYDFIVFEQVASYGMAVGAEVFETVFWTGRIIEAVMQHGQYPAADRMFRRDVKLHLCGQARAKDSNIRQALIDRFSGKETAIGKKAHQGRYTGSGPTNGKRWHLRSRFTIRAVARR